MASAAVIGQQAYLYCATHQCCALADRIGSLSLLLPNLLCGLIACFLFGLLTRLLSDLLPGFFDLSLGLLDLSLGLLDLSLGLFDLTLGLLFG
jgi:hypothetical protein